MRYTLPVVVTVNQPTLPTFTIATSICSGATAPTLPSSSLELITGICSPSEVSNMQSGVYIFTPTTGICATILASTVTVEDCAGIDEVEKTTFTVHPNPADDNFSITGLSLENGTIHFYTAEGKLIESRELSPLINESFDVKSLNVGIYFIQIGTTVQKMIVFQSNIQHQRIPSGFKTFTKWNPLGPNP